jgi:hypothetical protein
MPSSIAGVRSSLRPVSANRTRRGWTTLLLLAVLLPAVVAFGILYRQALTVPYLDDYDAIVAFAIDYEQSDSFEAKVLEIATKQHTEYKLSFAHSIVAAELEFTHHLNFTFLTVLGDLFLLPIGFLLWKTYQASGGDLNRRLYEFLPISLIFFSLSYWETLNWAVSGLQDVPVILFSLLAIYLLAGKDFSARGGRFLFACLAAALAAFTLANGFLLGPVGLLILLPRRAYARSLAWSASFIPPFISYLYHYTHYAPPTFMTGKSLYLSRVLSFLAFFGGVIANRWVAALLGLVILAILLVAIRSRFDRANPTAFYFTVWVVATGGGVSWVRGAMAFQTVSRYSIYSCLVLIFCYSFLAWYLPQCPLNFHRRRFYVTSVVAAVAFCFFVDLDANRHLEARRRMALTGIENYRADPKNNSPMNAPLLPSVVVSEKAFERVVLTQAIERGIYALPPRQ